MGRKRTRATKGTGAPGKVHPESPLSSFPPSSAGPPAIPECLDVPGTFDARLPFQCSETGELKMTRDGPTLSGRGCFVSPSSALVVLEDRLPSGVVDVRVTWGGTGGCPAELACGGGSLAFLTFARAVCPSPALASVRTVQPNEPTEVNPGSPPGTPIYSDGVLVGLALGQATGRSPSPQIWWLAELSKTDEVRQRWVATLRARTTPTDELSQLAEAFRGWARGLPARRLDTQAQSSDSLLAFLDRQQALPLIRSLRKLAKLVFEGGVTPPDGRGLLAYLVLRLASSTPVTVLAERYGRPVGETTPRRALTASVDLLQARSLEVLLASARSDLPAVDRDGEVQHFVKLADALREVVVAPTQQNIRDALRMDERLGSAKTYTHRTLARLLSESEEQSASWLNGLIAEEGNFAGLFEDWDLKKSGMEGLERAALWSRYVEVFRETYPRLDLFRLSREDPQDWEAALVFLLKAIISPNPPQSSQGSAHAL